MRAEELRFGNYIYYNDKIISVAPKAIEEFYYIGNTHSESLTDRRCYKPIELTEEILLKCGFAFNHQVDYSFCELKINKNLKLRTDDSINYKYVYLQYMSLELHKVQYLHELQNLYFALTNEELTINL